MTMGDLAPFARCGVPLLIMGLIAVGMNSRAGTGWMAFIAAAGWMAFYAVAFPPGVRD